MMFNDIGSGSQRDFDPESGCELELDAICAKKESPEAAYCQSLPHQKTCLTKSQMGRGKKKCHPWLCSSNFSQFPTSVWSTRMIDQLSGKSPW